MSCNCKNISPNQTCCCPKTPTTTTTLSPEQLANQECTQVFGSSSIVYNHTIYTQLGIPDCLGIRPNPTITDIINAIVGTFPECITTTTTTQAATTSTTTTTHIPCVNGNCPTGYTCVSGICQPSSCSIDIDCPSGFICVNGICISTTTTSTTTPTTTTSTTTAAPNSPCNSYSVNVVADCNYQTYNNLQSSLDFEAPEPTCGNYLGNSVWFTLTVPASGQLVISLQAGTITDAAMTVYTGSCTSLTQIACSDDQSPSYMMPEVVLTGLTPGITLFVRVWSYGNQQAGTFGICAINPTLNPCGVTAIASGITCVPTTTTTQAPVNVPSCGILYNSYYFYESSGIFKGSNLYYYNYNTNTSTLLSVPGATGPDKPGYLDIANTTNKLWFVDTVALKFIEYNISLSPWNAIFNQNIPFPTGFLSSGGLFAITNDILLVVNEFTGTPVVSEFYIPTGTLTPKFSLPSNRKVAGDILLTTNNKLIITTASKTTNTRWISQYNYSTYALEFEKSINISIPGPAISNPWGLFETGGEIYVMDKLTGVYRIDKNVPYAITYINTPVGQTPYDTIMGASQQRSCITESFIPTTTTTTTAAPTTTTTSSSTTTTTEPPFVEQNRSMMDFEVFSVCGINPSGVWDNPPVPYQKIYIGVGSEPCGDCSCISFIHGTGQGNDPLVKAVWEANANCNGECFVNCADDWTVVNLNTDRYANGDLIPQVSSSSFWSGLTTGAWCYYANNTANGTVYGKLYNRYALTDPRGLQLPAGYRLPTTVDWTNLKNCVGGHGYYLQNDTDWIDPSIPIQYYGAARTVFNALPGGYRKSSGAFADLGEYGRFWTLDGYTRVSLWSGDPSSIQTNGGIDPRTGLSVRLIKI